MQRLIERWTQILIVSAKLTVVDTESWDKILPWLLCQRFCANWASNLSFHLLGLTARFQKIFEFITRPAEIRLCLAISLAKKAFMAVTFGGFVGICDICWNMLR